MVVFQGPLLLKFLLLLKPCGFPRSVALFLEEGLLHSLGIGLVLSALRDTTGTVARIDASEEDTSSLSRREIDFQRENKKIVFYFGGF